MDTSNSIIVYRNPLERAIWESDLGFKLATGIGLSLAVVFLTNWLCEKYNRRFRGVGLQVMLTQGQTFLVIASGIVTMVATVWFLS